VTAYVDQYGHPIPYDQAMSALAAEETTSAASTQPSAGEFYVVPSSSSAPTSSAPPAPAPVAPSSAPASSAAPAPASSAPAASASGVSGGTGLNTPFPDGTIDCSTFPSEYGPIAVGWEGLGGWSGIQYPTWAGTDVSRIVTAVSGGSGCNQEGALCSYACPPGYEKSQWPANQPSDGASLGGIKCSGGKLYKTSTTSQTLCTAGSGTVSVVNNLSGSVPWCRTDYPGTESMTIPLEALPGQSYPLTTPVEENYYLHQGSLTSAQYYINPLNTELSTACTWGTGGNTGNWAPLVAGSGQKAGATWLGLLPNTPTNNYGSLDFNVEIQGDLSAECKYTAGTPIGGWPGCTVQVMSGDAKFVIS
jgi:hypothetical protein